MRSPIIHVLNTMMFRISKYFDSYPEGYSSAKIIKAK